MRIRSIVAREVPPVSYFEATDLADTVVVAGRNGVGKTRLVQAVIQRLRSVQNRPRGRPGSAELVRGVNLVIEATSADEKAAWQKDALDLSDPHDAMKLARTLQANRRRVKWRSSILQFESDRSIQRVQPYAFNWDVGDPWEEDIGWESGFGFLRDRFQDTVHSLFRKAQARRNKIARTADELIERGEQTMTLDFADPLDVFKSAFSQLLAPKELVSPDPKQQTLQYRADGQVRPIETLSSGEREVINIVFDFLLRVPSDCVVFFDEPELHLHPELSYKLLRTLQNVAGRNQFIYCTHSPDIITASLDQSVIFISPPQKDPKNQAIRVTPDDETSEALQALGHSVGIIALGKHIVLIEGRSASLDKQVYGAILGSSYPEMVLVPSEGRDVIASFRTINDKILRRSIWGVDFSMVCDRDAFPPAMDPTSLEQQAAGRLRVLRRYHLENYFLDPEVIAAVFADLEPDGADLRDPSFIGAKLVEIGRTRLSYTVALYAASSVRQLAGNVDVMPSNCHGIGQEELRAQLLLAAKAESARLGRVLDAGEVSAAVDAAWVQLNTALDDGSWVYSFPGKQVLDMFAARTRLGPARLKQAYLRIGLDHPNQPFADIYGIFDSLRGGLTGAVKLTRRTFRCEVCRTELAQMAKRGSVVWRAAHVTYHFTQNKAIMRAQEVFTPGSFPTHTYVDRPELGFADRLRDALATPGMLVSISGPSKSGKTVFIENTVGIDNLITISGAGIKSPEELWNRVLDWMQSPFEAAESRQSDRERSIGGEAAVEGGVPLFGKAKAGAQISRTQTEGTSESRTYRRRGLTQVAEEIATSDFVVLVDDFHYMDRGIQEEVTKQLKEAVRQEVKIIVAAVLHRADDVVRANPELRGRIMALDFEYWTDGHLIEIAEKGFGALNARLDPHAARSFALESSGSPQLMQGISLNACLETGLRERGLIPEIIMVDGTLERSIFERTAVTTDFRSLVDALDTGPPTRGTERKVFKFRDGTTGDVYRCILKAIAADPPALSFTYDELTERVRRICVEDAPVGSSVTESCRQMSLISADKFPRERPLDWDSERGGVLDLPDPYLLFYLRWSGRLMEPER